LQRNKSQGQVLGGEQLQEQQGELLGEIGSTEQQQQQGKPKFIGFMSKIGQDFQRAGGGVAKGFQRAFDETQKGLQKVAQVRGRGLLSRLDAYLPLLQLNGFICMQWMGCVHLWSACRSLLCAIPG
jgi:hypothetical protein